MTKAKYIKIIHITAMLSAFVVGNIFASVSSNLSNNQAIILPVSIDTIQIKCPENISTYTDINECSADISHGLNLQFPVNSLKTLIWEMSGATTEKSVKTGINNLNNYKFKEGTTVVTYRATNHQNITSTCSFKVIVSDNQSPRIINPSEVINATANIGDCNAIVKWAKPIVVDNCTPSSQILITNNFSSGNKFQVGTTEVQLTISDGNNSNNTNYSFLVVVNDEEMPILIAPEDISVNCGEGVPSAFTEWDDFQNAGGNATDNCNIIY